MAEWVLKGSVKGPQGDPGQDASLPSGGTEGQFLQKTADGEQWAGAVTATDMSDSGVTMYQLNADGSTPINGLVFSDDDGHNASTTGVISSFTSDSGTGSTIQLGSGLRSNGVPDAQSVITLTSGAVDGRCTSFLSFVAAGADAEKISSIELSVVEGMDTEFKIDDKTVNGFTDTIKSNAEGSLLPTDKAVADYVAENAGSGLPEGGAVGDVLTKTSSGEQWSSGNVFVDEETGYLKKYRDGELVNVNHAVIHSNDMNRYIDVNSADPSILVYGTGMESTSQRIRVESMDGFYAEMRARADEYAEIATNGRLTISSKSVSSITDDASGGSFSALATAKAVKDYVDALSATLSTPDVDEFLAYLDS